MTEVSERRLVRRRPLRLAGAAGGVLVLATAVPNEGSRGSTAHTAQREQDQASMVDPFIGTSGEFNTFPGADMPFGMIQWSPNTTHRNPAGGFHYDDTSIRGFSLTHIRGPGCPAWRDVPSLPTVGAVPPSPSDFSQRFGHGGELASPGYYAVNLGSAGELRTELTVTTRSGLGRFTYPATHQANRASRSAAAPPATARPPLRWSGIAR